MTGNRRSLRASTAFIAAAIAMMVALSRSPAVAQLGRMPIEIVLEGCVLPATDCSGTADVLKLLLQREDVSLRLISASVYNGHRGTGSLINDMTMRPLRAQGPDAVPENLRPGTRVRIQAMLLLPERMLLVRSISPSPTSSSTSGAIFSSILDSTLSGPMSGSNPSVPGALASRAADATLPASSIANAAGGTSDSTCTRIIPDFR